MFNWFKKKSNIKGCYETDMPIQYKMTDLDIAMENVKSYYSEINTRNKEILQDFIRMSEYFRDWVCAETNIHHHDIKISHVYNEDSFCNPEVTLTIPVNEKQGFTFRMGYRETYKRNCKEIADFVYKRQKAAENGTQKSFEKLKETLDKGTKIEIDLNQLLESFKETHFCYDDNGKKTFTANGSSDEWKFCNIIYDILIDNFGRERLIEMLEEKNDD